MRRFPGVVPAMISLFRLFLAVALIHPLEGVTFGDWLRLLRRERFRVNPFWWPRAALLTAQSLVNSAAARAVDRRFGAAVASNLGLADSRTLYIIRTSYESYSVREEATCSRPRS